VIRSVLHAENFETWYNAALTAPGRQLKAKDHRGMPKIGVERQDYLAQQKLENTYDELIRQCKKEHGLHNYASILSLNVGCV